MSKFGISHKRDGVAIVKSATFSLSPNRKFGILSCLLTAVSNDAFYSFK